MVAFDKLSTLRPDFRGRSMYKTLNEVFQNYDKDGALLKRIFMLTNGPEWDEQ